MPLCSSFKFQSIFARFEGYEIIKSLGFELNKSKVTSCRIANNNLLECIREVTIPTNYFKKQY